MVRRTHTYALLEVSPETHADVHAKLLAAGYEHVVDGDNAIDMHGLALVASAEHSKTEALAKIKEIAVQMADADPDGTEIEHINHNAIAAVLEYGRALKPRTR